MLFETSKYVYPLEDGIFDLKANWTMLDNFITIFLELREENLLEKHSGSPAVFRGAIGITKEEELGAC